MAYPTIDRPYGFKPVNLIGGRVYSGSTRTLPIQQGYATGLFNGDVLGVTAGLAVITPHAIATSGITAGAFAGVMVGAEYTQGTSGPLFGKMRNQFYPASTNAPDATAYVVDDPQQLFRACVVAQTAAAAAGTVSNSTTVGYVSPRYVGSNMLLSTTAGSTATGDSSMGVSGVAPLTTSSLNAATTVGTGVPLTTITGAGATGVFRIVQLVPDTAVTVTTTVTTAANSGTGFNLASTTGIQPGMQVVVLGANGTAAGAPGNTTYVTGVNGVGITVSASVTWAANQVISFIGYPEVIVAWNFGFHNYMNGTGA
jgi:hypothetical protein